MASGQQVPGPVRFHYERLLRAKGKPKATVANARKLCLDIYLDVDAGTELYEAGGVPDANAGLVRVAPRNRRSPEGAPAFV